MNTTKQSLKKPSSDELFVVAMYMIDDLHCDLANAEYSSSWEDICRAVDGWVELTCFLQLMPTKHREMLEKELEPHLLDDWAFWVTSVIEYNLRKLQGDSPEPARRCS